MAWREGWGGVGKQEDAVGTDGGGRKNSKMSACEKADKVQGGGRDQGADGNGWAIGTGSAYVDRVRNEKY